MIKRNQFLVFVCVASVLWIYIVYDNYNRGLDEIVVIDDTPDGATDASGVPDYDFNYTVSRAWTRWVVDNNNRMGECDQMSRNGTRLIVEGVKQAIPHGLESVYESTKTMWGYPHVHFATHSTPSHELGRYDLSVVIASRNDGYGGDSNERLARSLQQFINFRWAISVEVLVVEWNAVEPLLRDVDVIAKVLSTLRLRAGVTVRFINVPSEVAIGPNYPGFYCNMFEYFAKNVGMRRAVGTWVLVTNIDDVFSVPLLRFLDKSIYESTLDPYGFYTCTRGHVRNTFSDKYDYLINVDGTCIPQARKIPDTDTCHVEVSRRDVSYVGDFMLFNRSHLYKSGGFLEIFTNFGMDSEFLNRNVYRNGLNGYILHSCRYCHLRHSKVKQP